LGGHRRGDVDRLGGLAATRHRRRVARARSLLHTRRTVAASSGAAAGDAQGGCRDRRRQLRRRRSPRWTRPRRSARRRPPDRSPRPPERDPPVPGHAARLAPLGGGVRRLGGRRLLGAPAQPRDPNALAFPSGPPLRSAAGLVGTESTPPDRHGGRPSLDRVTGPRARLRRSRRRQLLRPQAPPGTGGTRQHRLPPSLVGTRRGDAVLPPLASQRRAGYVEQELRRVDPGRRLAVRHAAPSRSVAARIRLRCADTRRRIRRPPGVAVEGPNLRPGSTPCSPRTR
jgi:hypothetical protein